MTETSLLKEIAPGIVRVAVIFNPKTAPGGGSFFLGPFEPVARSFAVEPIAAPVTDAAQIESALAAIWREPGGGLIVMPDAFTTVQRKAIIALAAQHRFPAIYPYRYEVVDGGLMSYGADNVAMYRQSASYVAKILRGANPADLPIELPIKFELAVNLKTAKALNIELPTSILLRANDVIE